MMDKNELANLMLRYAEAQAEADKLRGQIETEVLALGKTQTVGSVRATYSAGRKSYDYHAAAADHPLVSAETRALFTRTTETVSVDWREICKHAGIADIPFTQSAPSVTVKAVGGVAG